MNWVSVFTFCTATLTGEPNLDQCFVWEDLTRYETVPDCQYAGDLQAADPFFMLEALDSLEGYFGDQPGIFHLNSCVHIQDLDNYLGEKGIDTDAEMI